MKTEKVDIICGKCWQRRDKVKVPKGGSRYVYFKCPCGNDNLAEPWYPRLFAYTELANLW